VLVLVLVLVHVLVLVLVLVNVFVHVPRARDRARPLGRSLRPDLPARSHEAHAILQNGPRSARLTSRRALELDHVHVKSTDTGTLCGHAYDPEREYGSPSTRKQSSAAGAG
jgi:hypothetical protein